MLLAVDIGNTNTKFGLYDDERQTRSWATPTGSLPDIVPHELATTRISRSIICSVVPHVTSSTSNWIEEKFFCEPVVVTNDLDFGLRIDYEPLSSLGTDRIVNAASAFHLYGGPLIVSSHGTALTVDLVTEDGDFRGGVIAPGIRTLAKALDIAAAQLPEVEIVKPETAIQNTTIGAIQAGVFYGYIGMFEGLVERIETEFGRDIKVVATGGMAETVATNSGRINILAPMLTLDGLRMLHERLTGLY